MSPSPMSLPLRGTRILRECIMMFLCIDSDCSLFLRKNTAQCRTGAMHNAGGELRLLGILRSSHTRSSRKFTIAAVRYPGAYLAEIGFLGYYSCFLIIHIGERTVAASVDARWESWLYPTLLRPHSVAE